jgi:environmental stress-induced protein Ves
MTSDLDSGSGPHLLSPADVRPVAWRNGAGLTRELMSVPERWRLSVAELRADAPFSAYPGWERVFLPLIDVVLVVDGTRRTVRRGTSTRFPGEASVALELISGSGLAVNLMTTQGPGAGSLRAWSRTQWEAAEHEPRAVFVDLDDVLVEVEMRSR